MSPPIRRVVMPVIGQQRGLSNVSAGQYSTTTAEQPAASAAAATHVFDASAPASVSLGGNTTMLIPGRQPLIAVGAVANDVPTLMSQLALASAAVYSGLPANLCSSSVVGPPTVAWPVDSSVPPGFNSQASDQHEPHGSFS